MLEILQECLDSTAEQLGLATIVEVTGSAPRGVGTSMAVTEGGDVIGSLSSGCIDAEIHAACVVAAECDVSSVHVFGYAAEDPFAVGLACGGTMTVVVAPVDRVTLLGLSPALCTHGRARLTWVQNQKEQARHSNVPAQDEIEARWHWVAEERTGQGLSGGRGGHPEQGLVHVHDESKKPRPRALLYGANAFSAATAVQLNLLGYQVHVCDPRQSFTDASSFPDCVVTVGSPLTHISQAAPELGPPDVVLMLAHDARFDAPVLEVALGSGAGYVGALGSRRTDRARRAALAASGHDDQLRPLHSPVGLDLGAQSPAEVAVAITAEIIGHRYHRASTVTSLRDTQGPVHAPVGPSEKPVMVVAPWT